MLEVLVADTSVLVDLDHGKLLAACLAHTWRMTVPDILHAYEIKTHAPLHAATQAIHVASLTANETGQIMVVRSANRALSVSDAAALVLAQSRGFTLLTGDRPLRRAAEAAGVPVHGTLWLLDRLYSDGALGPMQLHAALSAVSARPTCRLPQDEIDLRLRRWT